MNGAFLYDLWRSAPGWHPADLLNYSERYYARYPALSLGHHMPLLPVALMPFYALFGVSVFSARLAILTFFGVAIVLLYRLVTRIYDPTVAGWACLLFVTSPIIGSFSQRALSEMPAITLILAALNLIVRFRKTGRLRDYLLVIGAAAASLMSRPTAAYMLPAYGVFLVAEGGSSRFKQRGILIATLLAGALIVAAVLGIMVASPFNAAVVGHVLMRGVERSAFRAVLHTLTRERPLAVVALCGVAAALVNRDRRIVPVLIWIVSVLSCVVMLTGEIEAGRYSVLAVPAVCIVAASLAASVRGRSCRQAAAALLLIAAALQLRTSWARPLLETPGYEAAARYVVSRQSAPTVLYSAAVDTGYFVFFVRKHDPGRRLVVLRSDKLLTTSLMAQLNVEDLIRGPADVYPILRRYGTRFIVIEDRPSGSVALEWLREALLTDRFIERRRFPIGDGAAELRGVSLVVYEYRDAGEPEPGVMLDLNLPLAGMRIRVALSDLDGSPGRPHD
jgi:hypothetical protein